MRRSPQGIVRDDGRGRPVVIVHGGMSDASPWQRVADTVAERFRVVLIHRQLYQLDLPVDVATTMADQVSQLVAVVTSLGEPCVVVGHSSGAIIALEALAADRAAFAGGVLYEPPCPLEGLPLGDPMTVDRARTAIAGQHLGRALQIFLREGVRVPAAASVMAPAMALLPEVRRYVARQIDDLDSIVRLGDRSETYGQIDRPLWFLTGAKSPAHLRERCVRLTAALPHAELITLPGTGHGANQTHPRQLGELIGDFADLVRQD